MLAKSQPGQVFAYRFDWDEEGSVMGYDLSTALGAAHGLEIAFVFGEFEGGLGLSYLYPKTPARDQLSKSMMSYWAEFAHSGNPGKGRDGSGSAMVAVGYRRKDHDPSRHHTAGHPDVVRSDYGR